MRRSLLLGLLLLSGCSGLGHFLSDTERLPGRNPNAPTGVSENLQRSRGGDPGADPILPQEGNVWPGPPQPLPTLGDAFRTGGNAGGGPLGGAVLQRGGSMNMGEQDAVHRGAPLDEAGFSSGGFPGGKLPAGIPDPSSRFRAPGAKGSGASGSDGGSNIVIPNGDGTSTVISPDGSVKTVKGVPK